MSRTHAVRAALLLLAVGIVAGCASSGAAEGSDGGAGAGSESVVEASPSPSSGAAGYPVTIAAANGDVTLEASPEAIVSLSPTATEMLFAIAAGDQVTAVDDNSNHPAEAPMADLSALEPNIEAIAAYDPDLVVFSNDPGDLEASLVELGVPALLLPAATTLDDTYAQIDQLGTATGREAEAETLVGQMRSDIDKLVADAPSPASAAVYHELDDNYYSVNSNTFVGQLYGLLGLDNIADEAPGDAGDYPQLSSEFIIDADPDLIFLADTKCCGQNAETVAQRPGWDQIDAAADGAVIELDDDVASRWGPRVVDLLERMADAVERHLGATES